MPTAKNMSLLLQRYGVQHGTLERIQAKDQVFTDGMIYVKQHSDSQLFMLEDSLYEQLYGVTFSIPEELLLITKNLGKHFSPTPDLVEILFYELIRFHNLPIKAPEVDLQERAWQKFETRVHNNSVVTDASKQWLKAFLKETLSFEWEQESKGLVHTDPHLGNWVEKDGLVALIDFESVAQGNLAIDVGALVHAFLLKNEVPLANLLQSLYLAWGGSKAALSQGVWLKTSTALTWCAWRLGENELLRRKKVLVPLIADWTQD